MNIKEAKSHEALIKAKDKLLEARLHFDKIFQKGNVEHAAYDMNLRNAMHYIDESLRSFDLLLEVEFIPDEIKLATGNGYKKSFQISANGSEPNGTTAERI